MPPDAGRPGPARPDRAPYEWGNRPGPIAPDDVDQLPADDGWHERVHEAWAALGPMPDRAFGRELRRLREERGLSQRPAAAQWPIDQSKISRTEAGRRKLSLLEAVEISLQLRVPLTELLPEELRGLLAELAELAAATADGHGLGLEGRGLDATIDRPSPPAEPENATHDR